MASQMYHQNQVPTMRVSTLRSESVEPIVSAESSICCRRVRPLHRPSAFWLSRVGYWEPRQPGIAEFGEDGDGGIGLHRLFSHAPPLLPCKSPKRH